ncbi:F-box only protein 32 [Anopheles arabiensis]|uniref:F-box domain-containing protein n=1 Tax=Anopheles arabiensis TaxID=7173 RepID=A0A2C9GQU3_ANOAR|nr:F-box only protein 32 [Anopheles arabiensis]XP_061512943.1 F-box only protein 32 [Anopheles gambiae]XP_061512944.1 F-box only protein 32 [Anopheles gambiae]XP_061512945.1 F-box only protein 32 [Anopheles gambiae]
MPFISKDWRSPGDSWVKTDEGWEKLKVLECVKRKRCISECSSTSDTENDTENGDNEVVPPHCHITLKCTREIAGFNGLGEAVRRLDFRSSVRDGRRFNYVCALLRLLVSGKGITSLPGGAQRLLLQMLEEVATYVSDSQQNINVLRGLVQQLHALLNQENQKCWGKPLGSQSLWAEHVQTIQRIQDIASQIEIKEPGPNIRPKLHDLPEECVREIILRITDYKDLEASASAWSLMAALISEQRVWRELSHYHFTKQQIDVVLEKMCLQDTKERHRNWQAIYHALRKMYGVREELQYAEILAFCRLCRCLFWPSAGHPCIVDQCPDFRQRVQEAGNSNSNETQPVPPAKFLQYFSL